MGFMSEAELRALIARGVKVIPQGPAKQAVKTTRTTKSAAVSTRKQTDIETESDSDDVDKPAAGKGRDRALVAEYEFEPIEFRIDLPYNPRPKRRPRTVLNRKLISTAVFKARGNVERFFAMLLDPETKKSRAQITITPKATVEYENLVRSKVREVMGNNPPFCGPVKVELLFVLDGEKDRWPTSPADGDADNLEKAVADALNEIAFEDDRFIVITQRMKVCRPGEKGVYVRVSAANPADLSFNGMLERWAQLRS